jgi:hypothetical protein
MGAVRGSGGWSVELPHRRGGPWGVTPPVGSPIAHDGRSPARLGVVAGLARRPPRSAQSTGPRPPDCRASARRPSWSPQATARHLVDRESSLSGDPRVATARSEPRWLAFTGPRAGMGRGPLRRPRKLRSKSRVDVEVEASRPTSTSRRRGRRRRRGVAADGRRRDPTGRLRAPGAHDAGPRGWRDRRRLRPPPPAGRRGSRPCSLFEAFGRGGRRGLDQALQGLRLGFQRADRAAELVRGGERGVRRAGRGHPASSAAERPPIRVSAC